MEKWLFGLDSWVIQDGNYPDFNRGQIAEFAVEFHPKGPVCPAPRPAACSPRPVRWTLSRSTSDATRADGAWAYGGGPAYDLVGKIVHLDENSWVVDFGICAYFDQRPPAWMTPHDYVAFSAGLSVDHFTYFESLARIPGYPELIYTWRLERIGRETAPWVEKRQGYFERDDSQSAFEEIEATDAWNDDGGHASYAFECSLFDVAAKRQSSTAAY